MTEERVASIMETNLPPLAPETPIRRAAALLVEASIAAAPVTDAEGRLVGLLSQKDCFRPALLASYYREWTGCVRDRMAREVVTVEPQDDLIRAAEMFLAHPHRIFPVCEGRTVLGVLRRSSVLARLLDLG